MSREQIINDYLEHPTLSMAAIGRRHGISRQRVEQILRAGGVKTRPAPEATELESAEDILELHAGGMSATRIAKEVGVSRTRVLALLRKRGVYQRRYSREA